MLAPRRESARDAGRGRLRRNAGRRARVGSDLQPEAGARECRGLEGRAARLPPRDASPRRRRRARRPTTPPSCTARSPCGARARCRAARAARPPRGVRARARDCVERGWGTVRRRSVGLPDDGRAGSSRSRRTLASHDDSARRAPRRGPRSREPSRRSTARRSADSRAVRRPSPPRSSKLTTRIPGAAWAWRLRRLARPLRRIAALLRRAPGDGPFEAGSLATARSVGAADAVEVALAPGDVIVCPSEMEHRVGPVLAGVRVSMNTISGMSKKATTADPSSIATENTRVDQCDRMCYRRPPNDRGGVRRNTT